MNLYQSEDVTRISLFFFVLPYFVAFVPNHAFFERMVNVERIKVGEWQTIDTLISEEALLFAKYLRGKRPTWVPRIAELN